MYAVLLITPIPLPFVSSQVRNLVLGSMPAGSKLELGDMALALEGFVWPVIQFKPVTYTDVKTGGTRQHGRAGGRVLAGPRAGRTAGRHGNIVGPHLQVNQDLFGPRLAKFEYVDEPDGEPHRARIEGAGSVPGSDLFRRAGRREGAGARPKPRHAVGQRLAGLQPRGAATASPASCSRPSSGNFSRLVVRDGTLDMNDALYGVLPHFNDINIDIRRTPMQVGLGQLLAPVSVAP